MAHIWNEYRDGRQGPPFRKIAGPNGLAVALAEIATHDNVKVVSVTYSESDGYLIIIEHVTVITMYPPEERT